MPVFYFSCKTGEAMIWHHFRGRLRHPCAIHLPVSSHFLPRNCWPSLTGGKKKQKNSAGKISSNLSLSSTPCLSSLPCTHFLSFPAKHLSQCVWMYTMCVAIGPEVLRACPFWAEINYADLGFLRPLEKTEIPQMFLNRERNVRGAFFFRPHHLLHVR